MVESKDLQSSATLPGYRSLPKVCTLMAAKNKAARDSYDARSPSDSGKEIFDRTTWEAETLLAVCKKEDLDESTPYCPYHASSVSWCWKNKCTICAAIYAARIKSIKADVQNHSIGLLNQKTGILDNVVAAPIPSDVDGHPSHRFAQFPIVPGYPFRRDQSLPTTDLLRESTPEENAASKRDRRRAKACAKYPYCTTRKGTDTDLNTFTGRVLSLKNRSGQEVLGRHFTRGSTDRVAWH